MIRRFERIESLRTMHLGPRQVLLTARVRFVTPSDSADLPQIIARLKGALAAADPLLADVTIEPAPDTLNGG